MVCSTPTMPRLSVEKETTPAVEPRYGLFSAATVLEDMPPHAHNGVEYTTLCQPGLRLYPIADCPPGQAPTNPTKVAERTWATAEADPFALYGAESCPPGDRTEAQARNLLRRRIQSGERHLVELAVDSGHAGARPYLRHPDTAVLASGDPHTLLEAVGVLEQTLAELGRVGTIHIPRWLAPTLNDLDIVRRDGPRLRTLLGTTVAFGSGYSGRPPEGVDDTDSAVWLYATGPVTVRRSAIVEPATWSEGAFNPRTNVPFVLAERVYVVDWPCQALAIRTNVPRTYTVAPPVSPSPTLTLTPTQGETPLEVTATVNNWGLGPVVVDWGDDSPTTTVDDGAAATHTYTTAGAYTVTATSAANPTARTTATVTARAPVASPQDLDATDLTDTTATLSWSWQAGTGPDATGFQVRIYPDGQAPGAWTNLDAAARTHPFQGLEPTTEYHAQVRAVADGRFSPTSIFTFTTNPTPIPTVTATPTQGAVPLDVVVTVDNHNNGPVTIFFGDGGNAVPNPGDGTTTSAHTYTAPGTYTVKASSDANPDVVGQATVTVQAPPDPTVTATPTTGAAPLDVAVTVDNHTNGPVTVSWGDGTATATNPGDATTTSTHTYTAADTYTITVSSQAYPAATGTTTVTVTAP